jgi:isopentenyl diphosphate isomerase/L-lactate dehydrogenase-like FMN-dependent dehydrogenase
MYPLEIRRELTISTDASLTWEALRYLKQHTRLPIWVKGIMSPQDATLAIENGADAIFVSNHGGRQLDGSPPSLMVLESIVNTVAGRVPVVSSHWVKF